MRATFCQPQVASFGLTEAQAKDEGYNVTATTFPFSANGKAQGLGENLLQSLLVGFFFAVVLVLTALLREAFGAGSFAGAEIPGLKTYNVPLLIQPAGGFLVLAFVAAAFNKLPLPRKGSGFALLAAGLKEDKGEEAEQ